MASYSTAHALHATALCRSVLINVALRLVFFAFGASLALLTARILLWDVHGLGDLTVEHYLTAGALGSAIAASVCVGPVLRWGKVWIALVLLCGAMAATGYCLIGSAGRADELAFERNAVVRQVNKDRERSQRNRDETQRRYDTALAAETDECSRGAGPRCLGRRATTQERRSDLEVAELLLQQAKPEQRENGKLKRAAQIIALVTRKSERGSERALSVVWPFLPPFICELLTIAFLHLAFAPWKTTRSVTPTVPSDVPAIEKPHESPVTIQETVDADWTPVSVEHAREMARKVEAEGVFNALRSVQPKAVSNDELAAMLSVSKAESSRRVSDLVRVGMVRRQPVGRYVAISLRPLH